MGQVLFSLIISSSPSLNLKLDGKLIQSDIPKWLLDHKKTKIVSATINQAELFKEHTIPLNLPGNCLITGFTPYVNGEAYAYVTSAHCEGNFIKISVSNISNGTRTLAVGAVVDYIQL